MDASLYNLLLIAPAVLHLFHLRASSHSEHVVLQAAYEAATLHADNILEQVLALDPNALDGLASLGTDASVPMSAGPRDFLEYLAERLTDANSHSASYPAVQNVVQDALSEFQKIRYQLTLTE